MGNFVRYYFSDSTFWNQWTDLVPFICVNDISDLPIFQILIWNLVFGYLVDWKLGGLANQVEMEISSCFYQNPNVQPGICNLLNILNIWYLSFWGQRYSKNMGAIQNSCTIYSTIGCFSLCEFFLSAINDREILATRHRSLRALPVLPPKRYIESPQITASGNWGINFTKSFRYFRYLLNGGILHRK